METTNSSPSSSPPIKKFCAIDLSRDTADTVKAPLLVACSSLETSPLYSPGFVNFGNQMEHTCRDLSTPFKEYLKNPLVNAQTDERFQIFRQEMLKQQLDLRGGQLIKSNPKMRRNLRQRTKVEDGESDTDSSSTDIRNSTYYQNRAKNNASAKKSRERRKSKEVEIAIRATYLENMNQELLKELALARKQVAALQVELNRLNGGQQ